MRVTIDTQTQQMQIVDGKKEHSCSLYSREGFEALSSLWVKVGWNEKYSYMFSWFGRPIIQLPEDMVRTQEVLWRVRPDVIIETGVAHGGSLIFYASLCKAMGHGRVVGVDIEIRPANRAAIEQHELGGLITLIEGSSTGAAVVDAVKQNVAGSKKTLVILDSNHSYSHVLAELNAYAAIVGVGSYLVATDGIMRELGDVPRGNLDWVKDNPARAAAEFAASRKDFLLESPIPPFNESGLRQTPTHWPDAWLKRIA